VRRAIQLGVLERLLKPRRPVGRRDQLVDLHRLIRIARLADMQRLDIDLLIDVRNLRGIGDGGMLRLVSYELTVIVFDTGTRGRRDEQDDLIARRKLTALGWLLTHDEPVQIRLVALHPLRRRTQPQPPHRHDRLARPQTLKPLDPHTPNPRTRNRLKTLLRRDGGALGHAPSDREPVKPANEFSNAHRGSLASPKSQGSFVPRRTVG
jgi:hypothetical protein